MKNFMKIMLIIISLYATLLAKDVATVTGVSGEAIIQRDGTEIKINLGAILQEKDTVITNKNAKVQIIFKDETIVTIGKNSNFSISEYLFEDGAEPSAKFSMLKGAMRTITGKIGKIAPEKFKVTAKTATIGIRGTNFTINITEDNNTEVYCTFGAISVMVNDTEHIIEQGFFIVVFPDGKTDIRAFEPKDLKRVKKNFTPSTIQNTTDGEVLINNVPLDTTTENLESITIKDISNSSLDADFIKKETESNEIEESVSLVDLLAGYTMSDASYSGTYKVTSDQFSEILTATGDATLDIDFGADTITLSLEANSGDNVLFKDDPSFSGTGFSVNQNNYLPNNSVDTSIGTANGTFQGQTGQNVTGTFSFYGNEGTAKEEGTFDVSTDQELK